MRFNCRRIKNLRPVNKILVYGFSPTFYFGAIYMYIIARFQKYFQANADIKREKF